MKKKQKKKSPLSSLPRGPEWGRGRPTQVHADRRTRRRRSRGDQRRRALEEEF